MTGWEMGLTGAAGLLIGALIGGVGVGGVLLIPWLTQVVGLDVHAAVGAAMLGFIATGVVGLSVLAREGRLFNGLNWPLVIATVPGSFLGARVLAWVPDRFAYGLLAVGVGFAGWQLWRGRAARAPQVSRDPGWPTGLFVGFASALTGTGGPLVLMPLVIAQGMPVMAAVTLGQIVQLPIALVAGLGHVSAGTASPWLGAGLGLAMAPGYLLGRRWVAVMPIRLVSRLLAAVMLLSAALFAVKALGP